MKNSNKKNGFSLIEVILVVVLLSAAIGFSLLYYESSVVRADINSQATVLVSQLRLAQSNAQSGRTTGFKGIHLETNSYVTFTGDNYNPLAVNNLETTMPQTISIQNILLNGGGNDIIFTEPSGTTNTYGSFDLVSDSKTISINISPLGNINY